MLCLSEPREEAVRALLAEQRSRDFSYREVGESRGAAPAGYTVDHTRARLGQGAEVFAAAKRAIGCWKMFDIPWIRLCPPETPIEAGAIMAVVASHFGFWSIHPCRIVYVIDDHGPLERFGFAYGTLPKHSEIGEERFTVEFHAADQSVWYDIYAFSRPRGLLRLARPVARILQRRFAADSVKAMQRAVMMGEAKSERTARGTA
jgi:uncharacterized protein (UPF0548 family)